MQGHTPAGRKAIAQPEQAMQGVFVYVGATNAWCMVATIPAFLDLQIDPRACRVVYVDV